MVKSDLKMQALLLLAMVLATSHGQYVDTEVFVGIGSEAVLPCMVYSSDGHSSEVLWKKIIGEEQKTVWRRSKSGLEFRAMGNVPRAHCPVPNFGQGDYSLHIEKVREQDGGLYHCVVMGKEINTKKVMLRVMTVSFSSAEVLEGDNLIVTCKITPQPSNVMIKWELNGSQRSTQSSIILNNVSQKESGNWSCQVRNKQVGKQGKASASLQVKGILEPKDNSAVLYAELGSSVTLPCIVSDGAILNTSWKRASNTTGLALSLPPSFQNHSVPAVSQWDRSALIESLEEADQGVYTCSVQMKKANGKIVTMERNIELVTARVLSSSKSGRVALTCDLSNTSHVTHYEWIRLKYGENGTQKLTPVEKSTSKILNIPAVEMTDLGEWVCRFYEQHKLLGNVTYHRHMMSGLEGQKEPKSGKKVIMIIGLSLLLLLVLLIVLQMYKNHRRRKMIMQYPAMETIVHLAANERERRERSKKKDKELNADCSVDEKSISV